MKRADLADEHVIDLARRWKDGPMFTEPGVYAALVAEGVPEKVAMAKIMHLVKRGLLDYGVSLNFCWPA